MRPRDILRPWDNLRPSDKLRPRENLGRSDNFRPRNNFRPRIDSIVLTNKLTRPIGHFSNLVYAIPVSYVIALICWFRSHVATRHCRCLPIAYTLLISIREMCALSDPYQRQYLPKQPSGLITSDCNSCIPRRAFYVSPLFYDKLVLLWKSRFIYIFFRLCFPILCRTVTQKQIMCAITA